MACPRRWSRRPTRWNSTEGPAILETEQRILGTDHCKFGAWFAAVNYLPDTVVNVIEFHHHAAEWAEKWPLVALVAAADDMANHYHRTESADGYEPWSNPCWQFVAAKLSLTQRQRLNEHLRAFLGHAVGEADKVRKL